MGGTFLQHFKDTKRCIPNSLLLIFFIGGVDEGMFSAIEVIGEDAKFDDSSPSGMRTFLRIGSNKYAKSHDF